MAKMVSSKKNMKAIKENLTKLTGNGPSKSHVVDVQKRFEASVKKSKKNAKKRGVDY